VSSLLLHHGRNDLPSPLDAPRALTRPKPIFTIVGVLLGIRRAALDQTIVSTAKPILLVGIGIFLVGSTLCSLHARHPGGLPGRAGHDRGGAALTALVPALPLRETNR
jgi:hypothetical protein